MKFHNFWDPVKNYQSCKESEVYKPYNKNNSVNTNEFRKTQMIEPLKTLKWL